jgi:hypothetical protein
MKRALSSSRSDGLSLAVRFNALSLPKLLREMDVYIPSLRSRRQNRAWGGAPGIWRERTASPRSGRQLFVIRYFRVIEIGQWLSARFAGL